MSVPGSVGKHHREKSRLNDSAYGFPKHTTGTEYWIGVAAVDHDSGRERSL